MYLYSLAYRGLRHCVLHTYNHIRGNRHETLIFTSPPIQLRLRFISAESIVTSQQDALSLPPFATWTDNSDSSRV